MTVYPYLENTAINPVAPITIAKSATFSMYDLNDTGYLTPLNVTRLSDGVTVTTLLSDSNGYIPDFTVIDRTSLIIHDGSSGFSKTLVTSSPVPGPQGVKGDTGQTGPQGDPGTGIPAWTANTYYPLNQIILSPAGDVVTVTTAHTSGTTYDPTKFTVRAIPDKGAATAATYTSVDNMTVTGQYAVGISTDATALNMPSANSGTLRVYAFPNGIIYQEYRALETNWQVYFRRKTGGAWSAWEAPSKTANTYTDGKARNRPALTTATNLNLLTVPGAYPIAGFTNVSSMTPALPALASGVLEVFINGIAQHQRWTTSGAPRQVWQRELDSGTWTQWHRLDPAAKTSIISLSRSAGTAYTETNTDFHSRFPLRVSTPVDSFKVHIRNYEERTGTAYTGTVTITSIWIGPAAYDSTGAITGAFASTPTQIQTGFTYPADGSEWVSASFDRGVFAINPGVDYLVSIGYTAAQAYNRSYGGCWRNGYSAQAGQVNPSNSLIFGYFAPMNTWLEVVSKAPRIAMVGDSHTTGNGATAPVFESPINYNALANGAVPVNMGLGGSTLVEWSDSTQFKWTKYNLMGGADAWIMYLGQNDIYAATLPTLATLQTNYATVVGIGRSVLGPNMYVATIMPRNGANQTTAQDALRIQYNDWLRTLPYRAAGIFDFAAAIADPANASAVDARYISADNTHLNTAGCAKLSQAIVHSIGR